MRAFQRGSRGREIIHSWKLHAISPSVFRRSSSTSAPRWPSFSSPSRTSTPGAYGSTSATPRSSTTCTGSSASPRRRFYRKTAAELIQKFPDIVEPLTDGRLCLTTVVELAKVLTPENKDEVLPRFFQLSRAEAKEVTAELRPDEAPPRRDVVTAVRPATTAGLSLSLPAADPCQPAVQQANHSLESAPAPAPVRRDPPSVQPLTADESRVHVTVSRGFLKKLEAARDALSHSHPGAGIEEILEAGLDLLLERDAKRKGLVKKPCATPPPSSDPDYGPAHVRRAVFERDGGKCQFRLASDEICGSTRRLAIDHVTPRAPGGPSTVENCRLVCDVHNDRAARRAFGDAWMNRFTRDPRAAPAGAGARQPALAFSARSRNGTSSRSTSSGTSSGR